MKPILKLNSVSKSNNDPHDHEEIHKQINESIEMKNLHTFISNCLAKRYKKWSIEVVVNFSVGDPSIIQSDEETTKNSSLQAPVSLKDSFKKVRNVFSMKKNK